MIRDQFKDVKKVTAKEERKKATMGERNYFAKRVSKLQDLNKSLGVSMIITTSILAIAFVMVLLLYIATRGTEDPYETWRFVIWTVCFGGCLIFTLVWYIFLKPRNKKEIDRCRHELERISAKALIKAAGTYSLYGEDYKKNQIKKHEEEKAKTLKLAEEKKAEEKLLETNGKKDGESND